MADEGHGRVLNVTAIDLGDEIAVAAAAGATVMEVGDVADFDEAGGWLEVNGEVVAYTGIDDDTATISLATPLAGAVAEYDTVTLISAVGRPVREWSADIVLDDQEGGDSIAAALSHTLVDKLPQGVREGAGESVTWRREGSDVIVTGVLGEVPTTDTSFFDNPAATGILNAPAEIPTGVNWTTVKDFGAFDLVKMDYNSLTGIWTFAEDGIYAFTFGAVFEGNASNARGVRYRKHFLDGTSEGSRSVRLPALDGAMGLEINNAGMRFAAGEGLSFEVSQNSGGVLDLLGDGLSNRLTEVSIVRVAP